MGDANWDTFINPQPHPEPFEIPSHGPSTFKHEEPTLGNPQDGTYHEMPVIGVPLYAEDCTKKAGNNRFVVSGYKDIWATILFSLLTVAIVVGAVFGMILLHRLYTDPTVDEDFFNVFKMIAYSLAGCSGGAVVLSVIVLLLMRYLPRAYIITVNILHILLLIGVGILMYLFSKSLGPLIALSIIGLIQAVALCLAWKHIPLTALLLGFSVRIHARYPCTFLHSFLAIILEAIYVLLCILAGFAISVHCVNQDSSVSSGGIAAFVFIVFMWHWGSNVIMNVVHVTVAGVAATVYFLGTCVPSNPTWKSFVRATTTSFGSICLGSLVVAILQLIRFLVHMFIGGRNHVLSICLDCFLGLLENLMEWFNTYAFTYLAIYGESYLNSSKKAWKLIKKAPCATIFNHSLIGSTILATCSIAALVAFVVVMWVTEEPELSVMHWIWTFVCSFFVLRSVSVSVSALFVCVADAPDALQYAEPELHRKINWALNEAI